MSKTARSFVLLALLFVLSACGGDAGSDRSADRSSSDAATPAAPAEKVVELVFTYGSEKKNWLEEATEKFNRSAKRTSTGERIVVQPIAMGSGECIDELLNDQRQAHLTSPASLAFVRMGNARWRARKGEDLVGDTESLVLSPVVIAMWKPMAEALGWGQRPVGWGDILEMARQPQGWGAKGNSQWGNFKFGHTHPEYSNSGLISLFAEVYAGAGKVRGLTLEDIAKPEVGSYLADIESSVVHYGRSTGFFGDRMFAGGPGYLSAAVLYENMVIESYDPKHDLPFPIVAIYPSEGTFWSDHPVGIVNREWVTETHRAAARSYLDFLLAKEQQERALSFGFRPADPAIALASPIDLSHGVDPAEPKTTLEVPSVEVMDAIVRSWHQNKKKASVTLVLDVSGSMKDDDKLKNAKRGALQLVDMLAAADQFSLLPFNQESAFARQDVLLETGRADIQRDIESLFPSGGTALYDAIHQAFAHQSALAGSGKIAAIVVLSDGDDTDSAMKLEALLNEIRSDGERRTTRVFTIGYGSGAKKEVLQQIADATQAKYYDGNPKNITTVFKEISTFF